VGNLVFKGSNLHHVKGWREIYINNGIMVLSSVILTMFFGHVGNYQWQIQECIAPCHSSNRWYQDVNSIILQPRQWCCHVSSTGIGREGSRGKPNLPKICVWGLYEALCRPQIPSQEAKIWSHEGHGIYSQYGSNCDCLSPLIEEWKGVFCPY